MTSLPNHVSNLILSQRLRELKVEQKSLFYWQKNHHGDFEIVTDESLELDFKRNSYRLPEDLFCSAFLASELGEMLSVVSESNMLLAYGHVFNVPDTQIITPLGLQMCMRKPDIASKMLIFLLENRLLKN